MNFDEIEKLWRSPLNQPSKEQIEKDKMKFIQQLKRKRRGQIAFCTWIFLVLGFLTGKFILHLVSPHAESNRFDFGREWAIIPLLALPWMAWGYMVWQLLRHRKAHPNYEQTIQNSLKALLDENRMARERQWFIGITLVITAIVMPLIINQIKAVGKAGDEINVMYWGVPLLLGGILVSMFYHHTQKLLPQKKEMEELLQSYQSNGNSSSAAS